MDDNSLNHVVIIGAYLYQSLEENKLLITSIRFQKKKKKKKKNWFTLITQCVLNTKCVLT